MQKKESAKTPAAAAPAADPAQAPYYDILVAVVGTSPAVVTETLQALARDKDNPIKPLEIHIVTTTTGWNEFVAKMLGVGGEDRLRQYYNEFRDEYDIAFVEPQKHIIVAEDGNELDDIRDNAGNIAAANKIIEVLKAATKRRKGKDGKERETRIHASIAGGRKTMSFYLGYAMMLFARPQDRLVHVLVDAFFETCDEFYYVPKVSRSFTGTDPNTRKQLWKTPTAETIELGLLPVPLLGSYLTPKQIEQISDLADVNRAIAGVENLKPLILKSIDENHEAEPGIAGLPNVTIGTASFHLEPKEYVLYHLAAKVAKHGRKCEGLGDLPDDAIAALKERKNALDIDRCLVTSDFENWDHCSLMKNSIKKKLNRHLPDPVLAYYALDRAQAYYAPDPNDVDPSSYRPKQKPVTVIWLPLPPDKIKLPEE